MDDKHKEGDKMTGTWTDEQIVAEVRRLRDEKGYTEIEAGLIVLYHGMLPLFEKVDDSIEIENAVTNYRHGEIKRHREAREKRHK